MKFDTIPAALAGAKLFPVGLLKTPAVEQGTDWKEYRGAIPTSATGFGVNCGASGLYVIDLDRNHQAKDGVAIDGVDEWQKLLASKSQEHVATFTVRTPSGGLHYYYKLPVIDGFKFGNTSNKLAPAIDTRGEGGYVVGPGSLIFPKEAVETDGKLVFEINKSRKVAYEVEEDLPIAELPTWLALQLAAPPTVEAPRAQYNYSAPSGAMKQWQEDALREACTRISSASSGTRDDTLMTEARNMGLKLGPELAGIAVPQLEAAATAVGQPTEKARRHFEFGADHHTPWEPPANAGSTYSSPQANAATTGSQASKKQPSAYDPFFFTDLKQGKQYATMIEGRQVFVNEWKDWAHYGDQGAWAKDETFVTQTTLFSHLERQAEEVSENGSSEDARDAARLLGERTASGVLRVAASYSAITSRKFDQLKDELLVGNGVVNLQTGELREARAEDYFTKRSEVAFRPDATSPLLKKMLASFPEDTHDYLQVLAGQALTGHQPGTSNASVFFFNGDGRNGKSTFVDCLEMIAGTSATRLDASVLLAAGGRNNEFAFMPLKGARLAIFEELPDAKHLDAQAIKSIAGVKSKRAAEKYQKSEEVEIMSTIFIATNFLPAVAESDFGTWRRLVVIPSPYTFMPEESYNANDPTQKLQTPELVDAKRNGGLLEALMAWAVEGAQKWYARDRKLLDQPPSIQDASQKWKTRDDKLGWWLDDALEPCEGSFVLAQDAYESFKSYTKNNGQGHQGYQGWIEALKRSATVKAWGAAAGRGRTAKLSQSFYVPEERYVAKEDSDFVKKWTPRVAKIQEQIIKGVCFKSDKPAGDEPSRELLEDFLDDDDLLTTASED